MWVTCCSLSAVSTLMMPAIETITREQAEQAEAAGEPRRREDPQQAERRAGRRELHERDRDDVDRRDDGHPPEREAVPGDDDGRARDDDDDHDAGEEEHRVAREGADGDEHGDDEHDRRQQQLVQRRGALARAVDDVAAQPRRAGARGARITRVRIALRCDGHTETVTDAAARRAASRMVAAQRSPSRRGSEAEVAAEVPPQRRRRRCRRPSPSPSRPSRLGRVGGGLAVTVGPGIRRAVVVALVVCERGAP